MFFDLYSNLRELNRSGNFQIVMGKKLNFMFIVLLLREEIIIM